ncbi:hypothetical protein [Pseudomonas typographi]|uniref:hypothetical protein n=1 Tax=Pseudomonas typographi TaxID=2715964 RepID=UPI001689462D|nr:hypothetical protein [Pseudomonas typographi]MBD1590318.1 hypothetical protein [Pseudomonas typographi]
MTETKTLTHLAHRRSSVFIDEFVDKFTVMVISWNGDERLHVTLGRDSLEIQSEKIVPDPANPAKATLASAEMEPYRNDVAGLTMSIDTAEELAVALLKVVKQSRDRSKGIVP